MEKLFYRQSGGQRRKRPPPPPLPPICDEGYETNPSCRCEHEQEHFKEQNFKKDSLFPGNPDPDLRLCTQVPANGPVNCSYSGKSYNCFCPSHQTKTMIKNAQDRYQLKCCDSVDDPECQAAGWHEGLIDPEILRIKKEKNDFLNNLPEHQFDPKSISLAVQKQERTFSCPDDYYPRYLKDQAEHLGTLKKMVCAPGPDDPWKGNPPDWADDFEFSNFSANDYTCQNWENPCTYPYGPGGKEKLDELLAKQKAEIEKRAKTPTPSPDKPTTPTPVPTPTDQEKKDQMTKYLMWGGIGLAVLLMIVGIIIFFVMRKKKPEAFSSLFS